MKSISRKRMNLIVSAGWFSIFWALFIVAANTERGGVERLEITEWSGLQIRRVALLSPQDWGVGEAPLVIHYSPNGLPAIGWSGYVGGYRTRLGVFEVRHYSEVWGVA